MCNIFQMKMFNKLTRDHMVDVRLQVGHLYSGTEAQSGKGPLPAKLPEEKEEESRSEEEHVHLHRHSQTAGGAKRVVM